MWLSVTTAVTWKPASRCSELCAHSLKWPQRNICHAWLLASLSSPCTLCVFGSSAEEKCVCSRRRACVWVIAECESLEATENKTGNTCIHKGRTTFTELLVCRYVLQIIDLDWPLFQEKTHIWHGFLHPRNAAKTPKQLFLYFWSSIFEMHLHRTALLLEMLP